MYFRTNNKSLILAAIDIGSNAARLLIAEVFESDGKIEYNKLNLVRVPLRLGFDVFETSSISKHRQHMLMQTMKAYQHLMQVYEVSHYKAFATSAMRDATNAADITRKVRLETGISIEVINGDIEAQIIYENHAEEALDANGEYLYIDVGGGSTELSYFEKGVMVYKKSFNIGTIRLLKEMVTEGDWEALKNDVKKTTKNAKNVIAIGSGGNINKVFSLSKKKDGKPLHIDIIKEYYKTLSLLTVEERMHEFKLRTDRADVIVPALLIYNNVMRWANSEQIYVPKIGLADGIIKYLWKELNNK